MLSVDKVSQEGFNFREDGDVEWRPKSFLAIWGPAPPSRPRRLRIPVGAAPRRQLIVLTVALHVKESDSTVEVSACYCVCITSM